jgi:hypothetical protein
MFMNTIEKWFKNSTASQTLISNFWNINTYLILLITISALGWQGFTASLVSIREGCGNDGGHYCAMAGTSPLPNFPNTPYSQRVLLPFLVKLIFQPNEINETISAFALLNCIFIAVSTLLIYLIIKKTSNRTNLVLPIIGSCLFLLQPFSFRLTMTYPVLVDLLTLVFILLIIFLISLNNKISSTLAIVCGFLLVLTRLHLGVIALFLLIVFANSLKQQRIVTYIGSIIGIGLGAYIAFSQKFYGYSNPDYIEMIKIDFLLPLTDAHFFGRQLLLIFVGLGVYSVFIVFYFKQIKEKFILKFMITFATLNMVASLTFGAGGDTDRYFTLSGILILITLFSILSESKRKNYWLAPAIYSTIFLWEPFMYKFEDELRFEFMFARRWTEPAIVLERSSNVIAISLILFSMALFLKFKSKLR